MAYTKIHAIKATVDKAIDYICNPEKTDEKMFVSSYACSPETAAYDFKYTLDHCRENSPNKAYHLIQAFAPGEVGFEEAHRIGKELADKLLEGKYSYDIDKIQIGIPVICDEAKKVGLIKNGDVVLPSGIFGAQCRRNAYGYSYADKSKPKERRYVSTNWVHPFGNTNASEVAVDIYRPCWPQVEVPPYGIELQLFRSKDGQLYVIVVLTDEIRANYLKEAVNILLEIYGVCYIFDGEIQLDYSSKRQRCNWEMLPPGEMPSRHIKKQLGERGEKTDTYDIFRLEYMEKYNSEKIVEGINGFKGYYAFIFSKCCVLESAIYGNATYIIPKENWEILSQKTKKELFYENKVIGKIDHTAKWKQNVSDKFRMLEVVLSK